jgi:basic membrane protein A
MVARPMKSICAVLSINLSGVMIASGCAPISLDCAQPEVFCVGLVTEVGQRDDLAINQAAWEGIQQARSEGIADWIASIETIDARDYELNIQVFVEAGYDLIVTVGTEASAAMIAAAQQFPDSYFIGTDQRQSGNQIGFPNLTWLVYPEDQLGFLAGALAAAMTQTGRVGAVCGSDAWLPMKNYDDGFMAGAQYINPEVKATVAYHNDVGFAKSFSDPECGAAAAITLLDSGVDIFFGVGGTTGSNAVVTAAERGGYAIGADVDQYHLLPVASPRILTSVLKVIPGVLVDLLRSAREAQNQTAIFPFGNFDGPVGLAPYHDLASFVPGEVKQQLTDLTRSLVSGELESSMAP